MKHHFELSDYWSAIFAKDERAIRSFFLPEALIYWHNTNECMTAREFARVSANYPGSWNGEIQYELHVGEWNDDLVVCALHVFSTDSRASLHVCSAIQLHEGKISCINEYWGEDGVPPAWRKAMGLGRPIK